MKNGETTRRSEGGGVSIARPEHRLNIIKLGLKIQDENAVNSIARKRPTKTLLSLFAIESHFGKLALLDSASRATYLGRSHQSYDC